MRRFAVLFVVSTVLAGAEPAVESWPQYRGPGGSGVGDEKAKLPSEFGPAKAVRWKTGLPLGHGSPCIWGDRIFVTGFDKDAKKLEVIAVNRKDGRIAWRQTAPTTEFEKTHELSSPATSTPVTDGQRVYVYFGSYGLLAYEMDGKPAWEYPMGVGKSPFGSGGSPVLADDLVIVTRDYPPKPMIVAVSKKDGKEAWRTEMPVRDSPGPRTSHSTPVVWKDRIVMNRNGEVAAYSVTGGRRLWWVETATSGTSTPSELNGTLYVTAFSMGADPAGAVKLPPFPEALAKYDADKDGKLSEPEAPARDLYFLRRAGMPDTIDGAHFTIKLFFRGIDRNKDGFVDEGEYDAVGQRGSRLGASTRPSGLLALRLSGEGDASPDALLWSEKRSVPEVSAPLAWRGRVYMVTAGGILTCADAATGKVIYRGRVNAPGPYFASPIAAGGKLFVASADGVVSVVAGGETLEVLANNDLGEPVYGTPAPVGSTLYVRSAHHLWAFGE